MMQGGDPNGNGTGGSNKKIVGEFKANGYNNTISHVRGVISMARGGYSYDSASSQFFIMHEDYTGLDGQYAAFGYVTEGMNVVDKVCTTVKPIDNNGTIPSYAQPVINKIVISKVVEATADTAA
jgi:peptidyl-prolyl cis-trans isomerase B (cyclophilin B)